jgi:hypothetical protein
VVVDGQSFVHPFTIMNIQPNPNPHTLQMVNFVNCGKTNSLSILKRVVNHTGLAAPITAFQFKVSCQSGVSPLSLMPGVGPQVVPNIPIGDPCTLMENPVPTVPSPPFPANCVWTPSLLVNGVPMANGSQITMPTTPNPLPVILVNDLAC